MTGDKHYGTDSMDPIKTKVVWTKLSSLFVFYLAVTFIKSHVTNAVQLV